MKRPYEKPTVTDLGQEGSRLMNKLIVVGPGSVSPVAPELLLLLGTNALAGCYSRTWGVGISFDANRIEHGCPMVLWAVPGIPVLYWRARIEQIRVEKIPPQGSLRIVTNPNQPGAMQGGLSATTKSEHVSLYELEQPDKNGGWTVGGHLGLNVPCEGMIGVRIQAIARNVRVLWSAISQGYPE